MATTRKRSSPASKAQAIMKTKNSVVKRPARGFHRFRSGVLNVTPKGGEKELVKLNENSPLLRLPPELRTRIWEYVLDGNILRYDYGKGCYRRLKFPRGVKCTHRMDILRTCRQIYAEAAQLPYKVNTLSFPHYEQIKHELKPLKSFQQAQVTHIQLEIRKPYPVYLGVRNPIELSAWINKVNKHTLNLLPALRRIHVLVFDDDRKDDGISMEKYNTSIREELEVLLAGKEVIITFEVSEWKWSEYLDQWWPFPDY